VIPNAEGAGDLEAVEGFAVLSAELVGGLVAFDTQGVEQAADAAIQLDLAAELVEQVGLGGLLVALDAGAAGQILSQGFAKLASFDSNGDGVVDANDAQFANVKVWRDANGNVQTDAGELMSLTEAGVASLKVSYFALPAVDEQGNLHLERSTATLADGSSVAMTDVYFNVDAQDAAQAGVHLPTMAELLGNDVSLDQVLGASVAAADAAPAAAPVSDAAVATLAQLSALHQEQQYALMAA